MSDQLSKLSKATKRLVWLSAQLDNVEGFFKTLGVLVAILFLVLGIIDNHRMQKLPEFVEVSVSLNESYEELIPLVELRKLTSDQLDLATISSLKEFNEDNHADSLSNAYISLGYYECCSGNHVGKQGLKHKFVILYYLEDNPIPFAIYFTEVFPPGEAKDDFFWVSRYIEKFEYVEGTLLLEYTKRGSSWVWKPILYTLVLIAVLLYNWNSVFDKLIEMQEKKVISLRKNP